MKRVLVLGGGIAGIEAAIQLQAEGFETTLVSNRQFLYVYPISIWVPIGERTVAEVSIPLDRLSKVHGFKVLIDEVISISATASNVKLKHTGAIGYDRLIVAFGAAKMKPKGVEHTLSICGEPQDAEEIHRRLEDLLARRGGRVAVGFSGNPKDSSALRGGPAFELMFNLDRMLRRKGSRDAFTLTFFAPMKSPGARMGRGAVPALNRMFERLGIDRRFGKKIEEFLPDGIRFEDGSTLPSDLTVFVPAGTGSTAALASDLPLSEAGFIRIDDQCRVPGTDGKVYAIGDAAELTGPEWRAKQGHLAEIMARVAARNLALEHQGKEPVAGFREHLSIMCLMDMGNAGVYVYRDESRERMIYLPLLGHWMKAGWGYYYRKSKLREFPRLPGM